MTTAAAPIRLNTGRLPPLQNARQLADKPPGCYIFSVSPAPRTKTMNDKDRQQLKALGYIQ